MEVVNMEAYEGSGVFIQLINEQKGKGLVATKIFREDDIILEEKPVVCAQFLWNKLYKYKACDYCMKSMETAEEMARRLTDNPGLVLSHPECCALTTSADQHIVCGFCQTLYCSADCKAKAWSEYHQLLCLRESINDSNHPINKLQEIWRNLHFPPETASIMLIARILARMTKSTDKQATEAQFSTFVKVTKNEEEQIAHKLLGAQFSDQLEILRESTSEAFYSEDLQQWFTPEGFQSLFAMIGTNGQGIGTSSLSVWVKNCDALEIEPDERQQLDSFIDQLYEDLEKDDTSVKTSHKDPGACLTKRAKLMLNRIVMTPSSEDIRLCCHDNYVELSGTFLNCEGSGLYTMQSSCNHSCVPNAEITFPRNDHTLALVALRDISPGEEICISYIDECGRSRSRHSRQKILRENYLFTCRCEKCLSESDDPDCTSSEDDMEDDDDAD